jgi:acetylornithine deacetylase
VSLDPIQTLQRLIQTPSVNPMGRDVTGPIYGEGRLTELLEQFCRQHGWRSARQPVHAGRDNLLVFVAGRPALPEGGELILWDVHQDTVPVDGMSVEPFAAEIRQDRVYGRGACDVKGSMAAMLAALSRRNESAPATCPTIILACTANEECGYTGAQAVSRAFHDRSVFPRVPDAAIVAEPTGFNVVVAHQGQVRWRCHTAGRAAHSSRPDEGANAIYAMAQVVQAIERYHADLSTTANEHPLCGRPSVCVSTIRGGVAINTVPDETSIEIDRRFGPQDAPSDAYNQLVRYLADHADTARCQLHHDAPFMQSVGLSDTGNRPLAQRLASLARELGRSGQLVGAPYGTDAAALASCGVPTVVFGPGSIDQAHTADEFIAVEEVELATDAFYHIACTGLRESSGT